MSNTANSQQKRDIFKEWSDRRRAAAAQKTQISAKQEEEFLMSFESDNTHADSAALWTRAILYIMGAFLVYLSFTYYYKIFSETFNPMVALFFALALPIIVEIGTIALGQKALRAAMFGWYKESGASLAYWLIIAVISGGFFVWSYKISTRGVAEIARENAQENNKGIPLAEQIRISTEDVDAQIAEIKKSNEGAANMKNKRGRVNWTGSQIQQNNSATLSTLIEQRKLMVDQVTTEYNADKTTTTTKVNVWVNFVERFGGYGELIKFLAMLAIGFFEKRLYNVNAQEIAQREQEQQQHANKNTAPAPPLARQPATNGSAAPSGPAAYNRATGFHRENIDDDGNIRPVQARETVLQPDNTVLQQSAVIGADEILINVKKKLQVEMANFNNPQARNSTVHNRICRALDNTLTMIRNPAFHPSHEVGVQTYAYLYDTFAELKRMGWPYDIGDQFLHALYHQVANAPQPAATA